jgi:hypothetical protein
MYGENLPKNWLIEKNSTKLWGSHVLGTKEIDNNIYEHDKNI